LAVLFDELWGMFGSRSWGMASAGSQMQNGGHNLPPQRPTTPPSASPANRQPRPPPNLQRVHSVQHRVGDVRRLRARRPGGIDHCGAVGGGLRLQLRLRLRLWLRFRLRRVLRFWWVRAGAARDAVVGLPLEATNKKRRRPIDGRQPGRFRGTSGRHVLGVPDKPPHPRAIARGGGKPPQGPAAHSSRPACLSPPACRPGWPPARGPSGEGTASRAAPPAPGRRCDGGGCLWCVFAMRLEPCM
jgi:hypothetical protein